MSELHSQSHPVLPLRDIVVFPHMIVPLFVGREKSVRALEEVMAEDRQILLSSQIDPTVDEPTAEGIYRANIGLIAEADALLANLNPFRGSEPDSGTVFEIGYAIALGKRVVGYLEDARTVEVTARKRYFFRKTRRVSVRSAARRFSMARTSGPTMSQPSNSGRLI